MECKVSIFCCCFKQNSILFTNFCRTWKTGIVVRRAQRISVHCCQRNIWPVWILNKSRKYCLSRTIKGNNSKESWFINHSFWFKSFVFMWFYKLIIENSYLKLFHNKKNNNLGLIFIKNNLNSWGIYEH